jgi:hypothetical protein
VAIPVFLPRIAAAFRRRAFTISRFLAGRTCGRSARFGLGQRWRGSENNTANREKHRGCKTGHVKPLIISKINAEISPTIAPSGGPLQGRFEDLIGYLIAAGNKVYCVAGPKYPAAALGLPRPR